MKSFLLPLLIGACLLVVPQWAWAQPSNPANPQVLCFGSVEPYCVDCPAADPAGTPGSTYNWQIISGPFAGSIAINPAFPTQNHIQIDWSTSPAGNYVLEVTETNSLGCLGTPRTLNINIQPLNTASTPAPVTTCIDVALAPSITISTTGATGIGSATNLPSGLSASFSGDANAGTITISGTPTAAGSFNYSIPLTGGCGTVIATGSITVNPINTASAPAPVTTCINVALAPSITISTTGATGIGTATGLPAGLSASFSGDATAGTITISGTPTVAGPFNYSIPLTGGCGTVNATGSITVNPINTASTPAPVTACINVALAPSITISTTGATGIGTATGLPAGLSASFSGDATAGTITISGTPTAAGSFNYSIPLTGGCGTVNATGSINVTPENTVVGPNQDPISCVNEILPSVITFQTTGVTGIGTPIGLPSGLTAVFSGNATAGTITISGTPTTDTNGIAVPYSIPLVGGCGSLSASGSITINPPIVTTPISHN